MTSTIAAPPNAVKFHLALNVSDLSRSLKFYRILFGGEPARSLADYARFELDEPPIILSLRPLPHGRGGALNHLGFCVPSFADLLRMQATVEAAGFSTQREDGVECCHSRQTKFWVADPDTNQWEIYIREAGEDVREPAESPHACAPAGSCCAPTTAAPALRIWEHNLGLEIPSAIPSADRSIDEIFLRGTFNDRLDSSRRGQLLCEALRVLRPEGLLRLHGLVADRELDQTPLALPGPAAAVRRAPILSEILSELAAAGFSEMILERHGPAPCFEHRGVPLREVLLRARPSVGRSPFDLMQTVVYRGPLGEVRDDRGNRYRRGEPCDISTAAASRLRESPTVDQFIFLQ